MQRTLARLVTWPLTPVLFVATGVCQLNQPGGVSSFQMADLPVAVALLACWLVGVVVTWQAFEQRAGWAFLGLATSVAWSSCWDEYYALAKSPGRDLPIPELAATLGDTSFVWWFVFLALVLQFTPPFKPTSRVARSLPAVTIGAGIVYQVTALLRSTPLDPPNQAVTSPWAVPALNVIWQNLTAVAIYLLGVCLIASVVLLVRGWRRTEGEARQQLLWLVAGAVPLIPAVIAAFALSTVDLTAAASIVLGLAMTALVAGAALSVLRYRLYDVERVVTESAAYALASLAVVLVFAAVVVVISRTTPIASGSQLPTIAATLAGVGAARVSYVWGRRAVGRRIDPARFQAVDAVRAGLAAESADLDDLVVSALGSRARVIYPAAGGAWVTADGRQVEPRADAIDVRRHDKLTARLEFDPDESDPAVVAAVASEAAAEIDNVALRAELARQVELISESRTRLATAHQEERRRIERDLHDGAQQRLLAIALQLQSARVNGDGGRLEAETDRAITDLQVTVQELRVLAAGLQPAALAGGGLLAAVADLAARSPVTLTFDVVDRRFPTDLESAAWFVVAEAVTNAVKHSGTEEIRVCAENSDGRLRLRISDSGSGGADATGSGLQGLADRVSAAGGVLHVSDAEPHGTCVEAVFPCAS